MDEIWLVLAGFFAGGVSGVIAAMLFISFFENPPKGDMQGYDPSNESKKKI